MRKLGIVAELDKRINAVKLGKDTPAPKGELEEGDKVVGTLPTRLKKFLAVKLTSAEEFDNQHEAARERMTTLLLTPPSAMKPEDKAFLARLITQITKVKAIDDMFWLDVREEFPEAAAAESIAVCKGWKVVVRKPKNPLAVLLSLIERDLSILMDTPRR